MLRHTTAGLASRDLRPMTLRRTRATSYASNGRFHGGYGDANDAADELGDY